MTLFAIWLSGFAVRGFWIIMTKIHNMHPDYRLRDQIGFFIADAVILGALWPFVLVHIIWMQVINFLHGNA